jgi:phage repressor protein C with HTH and peptisase S24 domain
MSPQPISTRLGQYVVIEIAAPGVGVENAGVLLLDPQRGNLYMKMRRDLAELSEDDAEYLDALRSDLDAKAQEMGGGLLEWLEENASNFVRVSDRFEVMVDSYERTLTRLYTRHISPKVLPFRTHLPLYAAEAAAGSWGREMNVDEAEHDWVEVPEDLRLQKDMFVARVTGHSMEPLIPADSLCIFRGGSAIAGSREGKRLLVMNYGEPGENRFTVKRYKSIKRRTDEGWEHAEIWLEPLNPAYERWRLDEDARIKVIGEFVRVLEEPS